MKRIFFALFPDAERANRAVTRARDAGLLDDTKVRLHAGPVREEDLEFADSDGREGLVGGIIMGAMAGASAAFVASVFLGVGASAVLLVATALGMVAGAGFGALLSGIVGSSVPDRVLESWGYELSRGRAAVTVVARDRDRERAIEALFRECGAVEERKPAF